MAGNGWRTVRTDVRYLFYAGCAGVFVLAPVLCVLFLMNLLSGFAGESEFTQLSGSAARQRLSAWPEGVDAEEVESVSYKVEYTRDSYSAWYRLQLSADAASTWMNRIHRRQEDWSKQSVDPLYEGCEGVHRMITGPPPQHRQAGDTPSWWTPPGIDFRTTEVMLWYTNYDSGVGRATYSAFDQSTGVLWVYDYASQHDILWPHGSIPAGDVFSTIENDT